jgi:hypothetical protein
MTYDSRLENLLHEFGEFSKNDFNELQQRVRLFHANRRFFSDLAALQQEGTWLVAEGYLKLKEITSTRNLIRFYGPLDNLCHLPESFSEGTMVYCCQDVKMYCLPHDLIHEMEGFVNLLNLVKNMQSRMLSREVAWSNCMLLPYEQKVKLFKELYPGLLPLLSKTDLQLAFNMSKSTLYRNDKKY